jgi:hypothetical protein
MTTTTRSMKHDVSERVADTSRATYAGDLGHAGDEEPVVVDRAVTLDEQVAWARWIGKLRQTIEICGKQGTLARLPCPIKTRSRATTTFQEVGVTDVDGTR